MRTLVRLIVSLAIAAGICGVLIFTGVLQLGPKSDRVATETDKPAAPEQRLPTAEEKPPEAQRHPPSEEKKPAAEEKPPAPKALADTAASTEPVKASTQEKPAPEKKTPDTQASDTKPSQPPRADAANPPPRAEQVTTKDAKKPYIPIDEEIYRRCLSYLYFLAKDDTGNTERRFSKFLKTEFRLTDKQIDQMLQMTFWKNFLVLQRRWSAEDAGELQQAFDREVGLKKAGFEAKGIHLMNAEINAAKTKLSSLQRRLAQSSEKQTAPTEDAR